MSIGNQEQGAPSPFISLIKKQLQTRKVLPPPIQLKMVCSEHQHNSTITRKEGWFQKSRLDKRENSVGLHSLGDSPQPRQTA